LGGVGELVAVLDDGSDGQTLGEVLGAEGEFGLEGRDALGVLGVLDVDDDGEVLAREVGDHVLLAELALDREGDGRVRGLGALDDGQRSVDWEVLDNVVDVGARAGNEEVLRGSRRLSLL
jgi:hypothetical protein